MLPVPSGRDGVAQLLVDEDKDCIWADIDLVVESIVSLLPKVVHSSMTRKLPENRGRRTGTHFSPGNQRGPSVEKTGR